MATNANANSLLLPEIGPDGVPRESPVIAYTEKIIEEEKLQLKKYIEENYSKIRDVEREFANLSLELKLTSGSKNAAFEHMRKKIEVQNEKIRAAKIKEEQAKKCPCPELKLLILMGIISCYSDHINVIIARYVVNQVWEAAVRVVQDEEAVKQKLCVDLNNLVQESNNSQFARLEELKRRLEALNPGRASMSTAQSITSISSEPQPPIATEVNGVTANAPSPNPDNPEKVAIAISDNQPPVSDGEGRGKKKNLYHGKGRGLGALQKGRGTSGWTGAGFDVDGRN